MTVPRRSRLPGTSVRTTVPLPSTISSRTRSGLRSLNRIDATRVTQSHSGEKTFWTRGAVIGLGRVFRPCVTANAAAVPPSSAIDEQGREEPGHGPATLRGYVFAGRDEQLLPLARADGGAC